MNLFALPCFKRYPVITPPLKASRLNKRRGEGEFIKMRTYEPGRRGPSCQCKRSPLIEHLVHKLLAIINRFFFSFIKIPVLLKMSVLKNYVLLVPINCKIEFATNNHLIIAFHKIFSFQFNS